jgi:hypothetical protein
VIKDFNSKLILVNTQHGDSFVGSLPRMREVDRDTPKMGEQWRDLKKEQFTLERDKATLDRKKEDLDISQRRVEREQMDPTKRGTKEFMDGVRRYEMEKKAYETKVKDHDTRNSIYKRRLSVYNAEFARSTWTHESPPDVPPLADSRSAANSRPKADSRPPANSPNMPDLEGTTWNKKDSAGYLQTYKFLPNGKFSYTTENSSPPNIPNYGTWKQSGDRVEFTIGSFSTSRGQIRGNEIVGEGSNTLGMRWDFRISKK